MDDLFETAFDANRRLWDQRVAIHRRDDTGFYRVDDFLAGHDVLYPIEAAEIGDVRGLRIAHLQCHFGMDTICLARRGASVVGLDFSPEAVAEARRLASLTGADARFVEGNVYDARDLLEGQFDMVYTTWGTTMWLPDVAAWARVAASLLRPGGTFYFADGHPTMLCTDMIGDNIVVDYDWRTPAHQPLIESGDRSYTGDYEGESSSYEWIHSVADLVNACIGAGLRLEWLREHATMPWPHYPDMIATGDRMFRLPDTQPQVPLSLSLRAIRA